MTHAVAGLFESHRTADLVVEHLVQEYGIPRERVRVYARDATGAGEARSPQDSDPPLVPPLTGLLSLRRRVWACPRCWARRFIRPSCRRRPWVMVPSWSGVL